jgi:hypothetical protein
MARTGTRSMGFRILSAVLMLILPGMNVAFTTPGRQPFSSPPPSTSSLVSFSDDAKSFQLVEKITTFATAVVVAVTISPLAALAEEVADDYEYGAVNAPIGIAWAAGRLGL